MACERAPLAYNTWYFDAMEPYEKPARDGGTIALTRRGVLGAGLALPGIAAAATLTAGDATAARAVPEAMLNAATFGLRPGAPGDQSVALRTAIAEAQAKRASLFVPPGRYRVAEISITGPISIIGVAGATRFTFAGGKHFFEIADGDGVSLQGLRFDGRHQAQGDGGALLTIRDVANLLLTDCQFAAGRANGVTLERCVGRITAVEISDIAQTGLFSLNAQGLAITHAHVHDCGNNGIQIWRSKPGDDGTQVSQCRVERIRADAGGSGQNGNGINAFRAHGVQIAHNQVADCAYSAIRGNKASGLLVTGNNCARLGETAIYAEFGFDGAIITGNLIDQAQAGIAMTNFNEGGRLSICANNIVRNLVAGPGPVAFATGISGEADCVITGNLVENAPGTAIGLGWGKYLRDVSATGNVVRNSGTGIAVSVSAGAGTALLANNLVSGCKRGIAGFDHTRLVSANLLAEGATAQHGHISLSGNHES